MLFDFDSSLELRFFDSFLYYFRVFLFFRGVSAGATTSISFDCFSVQIRISKYRYSTICRLLPAFYLKVSVGATIPLSFDLLTILIRVSKIWFSMFPPEILLS